MFFNTRKPAFILTFALSLLAGCGLQLQETESTIQKSVPIPAELFVFIPDSSSMAALAAGPLQTQQTAVPLRKALVKINPERIEAAVVLWDMDAEMAHHQDGATGGSSYYETFWNDHENQFKRWDYQIEYYNQHPVYRMIYHGALSRSGDYATGNVTVTRGLNEVYIGFVMPGDTVHAIGTAHYYWDYDTFEDGWRLPYSSMPVDTLRPVYDQVF
jgi:hypothetical protein